MIKKRELIQDNLSNSTWLGEVVDNSDPEELGRVRIKVYGKFDELETELIPWANPMNQVTAGSASGSGFFSVPKIGSIVNVKFDNGNLYFPEYFTFQHMSDDMKAEISGDNYANAQVLWYDTEVEGGLKIFYTQEKGVMIFLNDSIVNIRTDNTVLLQHKNGKIVHIQEEKISLGKENESDEPAVLGEKNVTALKEISGKIQDLCSAIETASKSITSIASNAPILAPLVGAWSPLEAQATEIRMYLKGTTDTTTIPQTRSESVSLDGPSMM